MYFSNPNDDSQERDSSPQGGAGRVWYVLTTHFFKLVRVNLLFILFSLPVVTLPAAMAGMTAVIHALYRQGNCFVWDTFFREFRAEFLPRTLWGLLMPALPAAGWFLGGMVSEWMAYLISAILLAAVLMAMGYWFPQLALLKLSSGQCMRNALLLTALEPVCNFRLLLCQGIAGAVTIIAWPFSAPLLLLLIPALVQLLNAAAVTPVLEARLIHEEDT